MQRPLNLAVRGVELTPAIEADIHQRVAALERFFPRLIGCSVLVDGPGGHHRQGGTYAVRLDLSVPDAEPILINRPKRTVLARAVDEVFDAAERRLEDLARVQRGQVKRHEPQLRARVVRLSPQRDHGFLRTADGRELYFHRHSVLGDFDTLAPGAEVRFHEETGDDGPQASTVVIVGGGASRARGRATG
jgi:cold shock CspA family protein